MKEPCQEKADREPRCPAEERPGPAADEVEHPRGVRGNVLENPAGWVYCIKVRFEPPLRKELHVEPTAVHVRGEPPVADLTLREPDTPARSGDVLLRGDADATSWRKLCERRVDVLPVVRQIGRCRRGPPSKSEGREARRHGATLALRRAGRVARIIGGRGAQLAVFLVWGALFSTYWMTRTFGECLVELLTGEG